MLDTIKIQQLIDALESDNLPFEWDFGNPSYCAMGLLRSMWPAERRQYVNGIGTYLGLPSEELFFAEHPNWRGNLYDKTPPSVIADRLRTVLETGNWYSIEEKENK